MKIKNCMVLAIMLALISFVAIQPAIAQPEAHTHATKYGYRFSYTPIYQFDTDIDSGGKFNVQRHYLRFDASRFINPRWMIGLGLSFDYEHWQFSDVAGLSGVEPWDDIFRPGISLPLFYRPGNQWQFSMIPSIEWAGASGADADQSLLYGSVFSAAYEFGPNLKMGFGGGVFNRLDETVFFPYLVIQWQIAPSLSLSNPFPAGPAGPAGLELVFSPNQQLEIGAGGAYRAYRFRLDDSAAVKDGIGEVDFWSPFFRIGTRMWGWCRLDVSAGALVGGSLTINDRNNTKIGDTDYDAAPFAALTVSGQF